MSVTAEPEAQNQEPQQAEMRFGMSPEAFDIEEERDSAELPDEEVSGEGEQSAEGSKPNAGGEQEDESGEALDVPKLDYRLVVKAGQMGLSDEAVMRLGSNEALEAALGFLEEQIAQAPPKQQAAAPAAPAEEIKWPEISLDPEAYDEKLVATVNGLNDGYKQIVGGLLGRVGQMQEALAKIEQRAAEDSYNRKLDAFDDTVNSLGETWQKVFGGEGRQKLDRKSEAFKNRAKLFDEVEMLEGVYAAKKRQVGMADIIKQALNTAFPDESKTRIKAGLVKKVKARETQLLERPAQRRRANEDLSPEQRAYKNAVARMREKGLEYDDADVFDKDGLL